MAHQFVQFATLLPTDFLMFRNYVAILGTFIPAGNINS